VITDTDSVSPALVLTPAEMTCVRELARCDSAAVLAAALASVLVDVEGSSALIERMLATEAR
jgi:hypothetical protein